MVIGGVVREGGYRWSSERERVPTSFIKFY